MSDSARQLARAAMITAAYAKNVAANPERAMRPWAYSFAGRPRAFLRQIIGEEWDGPDWVAWRAFVSAVFGEPFDSAEEEQIFRKSTCLDALPTERVTRVWVPVGRRGGKSRVLAGIAVYLACCFDWTPYLAAGELGVIPVIAQDRKGAQTIMGYVKGFLEHPELRKRVVGDMAVESVRLEGSVLIEVVTASYRAVRSRTVLAALCVAKGTLVETAEGSKPIETINAGDLVWTRDGLRRVLKADETNSSAIVYKVEFSSGKNLVATAEHPVYIKHKGFIPVYSLETGDEVLAWEEIAPIAGLLPQVEERDANLALRSYANKYYAPVYHLQTAAVSLSGTVRGGLARQTINLIKTGDGNSSIVKYTWRHMVGSLHQSMSTIKMRIQETFHSIIWKLSPEQSICKNILQKDGVIGVLVIPGTQSESMLCGQHENQLSVLVAFAERYFTRLECALNIAVKHVKERLIVSAQENLFVQAAEKRFAKQSSKVPSPQSTVVTSVTLLSTKAPVYNLEVEGKPEYFANGILVHNCDEIAFWRIEDTSANPDTEIVAALEPAMATIPNALLLAASSPYARRGVLWNNFDRHFGQPGRNLVWKAPTWVMHPSIKEDGEFIRGKYEEDPISASAEYGAEFRTDVQAFVTREVVDGAVVRDRRELLPDRSLTYKGYVDPSGGSSDSFSLAIGHRDPNTGCAVLDVIREREPPYSPEAVVKEYAEILKVYRVGRIKGDRYAGEWPRERFRTHGVEYEVCGKPASQIYLEFLPLLNAGRVELLDHSRMKSQLLGLERRSLRSGREMIDHPPRSHDDVANVTAGVLVELLGKRDMLAIDPDFLAKTGRIVGGGRGAHPSGPVWR